MLNNFSTKFLKSEILTSRMIHRRGWPLAAKVFIEGGGDQLEPASGRVEEDLELLVINDASIDSLGHGLLMTWSRQAGVWPWQWAVCCSTWPRRELGAVR
jgi:hypothetical protein